MPESKSGLRAILSFPFVYHSFQWLVGTPRMRKFIFKNFISFPENAKVLDIGCGPGELLDYIPATADYTGFDKDKECILYAQKKFGDRGKFLHLEVSDLHQLQVHENEYDVVLLFSILHHLNDHEAEKTLKLARYCLKPSGIAVSVDGVYLKDQSRAAKYILSKDRGQHVRKDEDYVRLAKNVFERTEVHIEKKLLRIPTDLIIMKMTK
jgi:SAM-dependent methyltransferase